MKKITLILFLFTAAFSTAQTFPLDFSDPLDDFTDAGSVFSIIAEPTMTSNMVGEIIGGGGQYDNVQLDLANFVDVSGANKVITFRFFNPDADVMPGLFQLANSSDGSPAVEVPFTSNVNGAWQTITVDFANAGNAYPFCAGCPQDTPVALDKYSKIVFFTDFAVFTTDTYYVDDIAGAADGGPVGGLPTPQVAAPTPTAPAADVISMFSNAYTDVAVDTWRTSWSSSAFADIQVAGDDVKEYKALDFNGIETTSSPIDASTPGMMFFNLDVWTSNATTFRVKLVDFKGDGFQGANGDTEAELSFNPGFNAWETISIPLSDFTAAGMTDFADINQYIISAQPVGTAEVYIDNVYFSVNSTATNNDVNKAAITVYPNPSENNYWNINSAGATIESVQLFSTLGQEVLNLQVSGNDVRIDNSDLTAGIYLAVVSSATGTQTFKLIK
ncbi:MAG: T9SS type A sorting domain-containing protein [Nonlabens sp.]|uniref:T9SS type A sorting domain-containing protein n=1 Tax=Nonlabens sp. TaxID=1888209 RepID=UPI003EF402C0